MINIISECKSRIRDLDYLMRVIDWNSIQNQLKINPNLYSEKKIGSPLNLIEAIMRPSLNSFYVNNTFDYKLNLVALNIAIETLWATLEPNEIKSISDKISNLSNTGFWDTTVELWFAKNLVNNNNKVVLDYPLQKYIKGHTPPNADIAIINQNNAPEWLIDCLSPTLEYNCCKDLKLFSENIEDDDGEENLVLEPLKAIKCISINVQKKFELKFAKHLEFFPKTKFAIIISLIKSDELLFHLSDRSVIKKIPILVDISKPGFNKRMTYAFAGRFGKISNDIVFDKLIEFRSP